MKNQSRKPPLRILQVHSFYYKYLGQFYSRRPKLYRDSVQAQEKALLEDAFAAVHMLAPYMRKYSCVSELVIANCKPLQLMWGKENNVDTEDPLALLRARIEAFQPDVLYLGESIQYDSAFVRSLGFRPKLVLGWRGADVPINTDWSEFDVILSGLPRLLNAALTLGAREGEFFLPGIPGWIPKMLAEIPQDTDVVFAGGMSPSQHGRRQALLDALAKAASREGFSLALHFPVPSPLEMITPAMRPYLREPVFGLEMHKALRRGRIVFDTRGEIGLIRPDGRRIFDLAGEDTVNMRLFEGTAGGSMVMTDDLPGLSRLFEPGKEVAVFAEEGDLLEKVLYYLQNKEEREAIASQGQKRCLECWNMDVAVKNFLNIVKTRLAAKDSEY